MTSQVRASSDPGGLRARLDARRSAVIATAGGYGAHNVRRGEEHRDSDTDLVVVLPEVTDKHAAAVAVRRATAALPVPLDVIAVDPEEIRRRGDEIGSVLRPALREGQVVHDRAA